MKKIKFIFSILIIITTLSCETESEISDVKNSQYKVKKITKDQIISKEVIFQKIKQIEKNENQDKTLNKQVYISDLNIFVDTDSGRYLENEATGDHSYVFPIFEFNPQNNNLKNLLFDYIGNNEYDTYIVEYGFTEVEYPNLSFQQLSQRQTKFHKINLNSTIILDGTTQSKSSSTPYQICLEVWEQVLIPNDQGEVIAGSDLWVWGETLIASECQVIGGGGGGSGNGSGGNSGGGSGQGNGGGGSGSGSTPYTGYSPIVSTVTTTNDAVINGNLVTGFVNQLGYSEKIWWNSTATTQQKVDIITLLLDNKTVDNVISNDAIQFINWAINYLIRNPNVTWDQFKNWYMTPREGQDFFYDANFWENPNLSFEQQDLPSWDDFDLSYPRLDGADLVELVGGDVQAAYLAYPSLTRGYCALKLSRALNYSGVDIPQITTTSGSPGTILGDDGFYYFLNAKALNKWMRETFGTNPATDTTPLNENHTHIDGSEGGENGENYADLTSGIKGIYSMVSTNSQWASGHADLIDDGVCVFGCHFYDTPPAPIDYIDIWELE